MDYYEQIGPFQVRIARPENNTYSLETPNPLWEELGNKWLEFAEKDILNNLHYKVAYLPHTPIEIKFDNHELYRLPQYCDMDKLPSGRNLILGKFIKQGEPQIVFRLYASYQHPSGPFGGVKANVDLLPMQHAKVVLGLLKIAEIIFPPGTVD